MRHVPLDRIIKVNKSVKDHVCADSDNERMFMQEMETTSNVALYAKLPLGFFIPTPVGHYTPDWAVVFNEKNGWTKLYFVAETKATMSEIELREEENIKIKCARSLFRELFKDKGIRFEQVDSLDALIDRAFKAL